MWKNTLFPNCLNWRLIHINSIYLKSSSEEIRLKPVVEHGEFGPQEDAWRPAGSQEKYLLDCRSCKSGETGTMWEGAFQRLHVELCRTQPVILKLNFFSNMH